MTDQNDRKSGGTRIERDDYGRSDIQPEQQADTGGGRQMGGAPSQSDMQEGGGSGTGGYGNDQNSENMQGQQRQAGYRDSDDMEQGGRSRGERFDEQQGGGRGGGEWDRQQGMSQSQQGGGELRQDQRDHQDRGQGEIEKDQS